MKIKKMLYWIIGKEYSEKSEYPREFLIIDFSPVAKERGLRGESNKIIYHYSINKYGNREVKKHFYSQEKVYALKNVYKIPLFDKTKEKEQLPIFGKILPGEAMYRE